MFFGKKTKEQQERETKADTQLILISKKRPDGQYDFDI
jgi:hypothetical protein